MDTKRFLLLGTWITFCFAFMMVGCADDKSGNGGIGASNGGSGGVGGAGDESPGGAGGAGADEGQGVGGDGGAGADEGQGVGGDGGAGADEGQGVGGDGGAGADEGQGGGDRPVCFDDVRNTPNCEVVCEQLVQCALSNDFCPTFDPNNELVLQQECEEVCNNEQFRNPLGGAICQVDTCEDKYGVLEAFNRADNGITIFTANACIDSLFTNDEAQDFINMNCAPCHIDGNQRNGLNLDDILSVVGVDSTSMVPQITAGDHENSYVWRKMDGSQGVVGGGGATMPSGRPQLPQEDQDAFATWIDSLDD